MAATPTVPSIIGGPASVTVDSNQFYTAGDVSVRAVVGQIEPMSNHGSGGVRMTSLHYEITFTPSELPAVADIANLMKLYRHAGLSIGAAGDLYPGHDVLGKTVVVEGLRATSDSKITFGNAGVVGYPSISLGPGVGSFFGQCTIVACPVAGKVPSDADYIAKVEPATGLDHLAAEELIPSPRATASWNSITEIEADLNGFQIEFGAAYQMFPPSGGYGSVRAVMTDISPKLKFLPVNKDTGLDITEAIAMVWSGTGNGTIHRPGDLLSDIPATTAGSPFVVTAPWCAKNIVLTLKNASFADNGFSYSVSALRNTPMTVVPSRRSTDAPWVTLTFS
jgi:hypothetical protein